MAWMRQNISPQQHATVTNVSGAYACLALMGPRSRELLQRVSPYTDLSNEAFPFNTSRDIDVGLSVVTAKRVTYVGELGWELYVGTESAHQVYDALFAAEREAKLGLRNGGYYAVDSLRMEKGYRAWGHELTSDVSPLEAGLGFAVDFSKPSFIGREALLRQKEAGIKRRLVQIKINDPTVWPWGDEAIYRDGSLLGTCSSSSFG